MLLLSAIIMPIFAHLTRTHGSISLWRGVVPTAWREAIYTAGQFPCRERQFPCRG